MTIESGREAKEAQARKGEITSRRARCPRANSWSRRAVFERQVHEAKANFQFFMTQERRLLLFASVNTSTTIGMMCGHASLGIAKLVYLETDFNGGTVRVVEEAACCLFGT